MDGKHGTAAGTTLGEPASRVYAGQIALALEHLHANGRYN